MGASQSAPEVVEATPTPIIKASIRNNKFIRTIIRATKFRFSFHMPATHRDATQLMEKWDDFINDTMNNTTFNYKSTADIPQHVRCEKESGKILLTVTTTIELSEEELGYMTQMFKMSSELAHSHALELAIDGTLHRTPNSITSFGSVTSSINLLEEAAPSS